MTSMVGATTSRDRTGRDVMPPQRLLARSPAVLAVRDHRAPQALCDTLWHVVHAFRSPEAARDDRTLIAVRAGANTGSERWPSLCTR